MKSFMKKTLAVILALMMLSGSMMCLAAVELNQEAVSAHYGQYNNYLLLGDSVASGYRDVITDRDQQFNTETLESAFNRIEGSYADIIADAIIEDGSMTAMAGPGFRTIEIRYMLEDDYAASCTDEYLFYCSNIHSNGDPITKWRPLYQQAVREADLITLGVGGNDWGAYIGWVIVQTLIDAGIYDELLNKINVIMDGANLDLAIVGDILEIVATNSEAFADVITKLPEAVEYGLTNFYANWDIMIQDIYDYNPDVTLMVVGMSDNGLKGKYYDYDGVEGGPVESSAIGTAEGAMKYVVETIMAVGNAPMIEGAKKFGYTYVDTTGTTYVESHPDADGHVHIANKIIEALPSKEFYGKYSDVTPGHKYYSAIEYVVANGIMEGTTETTFSPDEYLTSGELHAAINAITGSTNKTDSTKQTNALQLATSLVTIGAKKGFIGFFKSFTVLFKVLADYNYNIGASITRAEAAFYLMSVAEL